MKPRERNVLMAVGGSRFYEPARDGSDASALAALLIDGLIQPTQQGKLHGYALTAAGYQRWLGHHQANERA